MQAISVRLPWAALLVLQIKDVENRTHNRLQKVRGELVICASQRVDWESYEMLKRFGCIVPAVETLMKFTGHAIGTVQAYDHRKRLGTGSYWEDFLKLMIRIEQNDQTERTYSNWHEPGRYGLYVREARVLAKPYPVRGALGVFDAQANCR